MQPLFWRLGVLRETPRVCLIHVTVLLPWCYITKSILVHIRACLPALLRLPAILTSTTIEHPLNCDLEFFEFSLLFSLFDPLVILVAIVIDSSRHFR